MPILDLRDFRPTPTQERFLLDTTTRIRGLIGGLGSGKTRTGAEAALDLALANPGCDGLIAAPTHPMLARLSLRDFLRACPRELIVGRNRQERWIRLRGDRTIWYGSADRPDTLEGTNVAWFWGDEVRYWKREAWRNVIARLRDKRARRLQGVVTTTPAMNWLAEEFDTGRAGRSVYRISTRENACNLGPGYIEDLERSYSARLAHSLIDGRFTVVEGQVYESFDDARHLIDWPRARPGMRHTLWGDFGVQHGAWLLVDELGEYPEHDEAGRSIPAGSLVIVDELQPEQVATERAIPMLRAMLEAHGIRSLDAIYCDPAGRARDIASGMTSVHLLESAFGRVVRFETAPANTWIPNGIARVEGALAPLRGEPTLYLDRKLSRRVSREGVNDFSRGIYRTLRGLRYPERRSTGAADHPVVDEYEHAGDALRYGVINTQEARREHDSTQPTALARGGRRPDETRRMLRIHGS